MQSEERKDRQDKKDFDRTVEPEEKLYTWELEYIRDEIVKRGLQQKEVAEQAERLKMELATLTIVDNLDTTSRNSTKDSTAKLNRSRRWE